MGLFFVFLKVKNLDKFAKSCYIQPSHQNKKERERDMFQVVRLLDTDRRGWTVYIDGVETGVCEITIVGPKGELRYGKRPEGYDAWVFREEAGGGSVTLLFTRDLNGNLLVGLIREKRANMGNAPVWCIMGGFVKHGESHEQAQQREAAQEGDINTSAAQILRGVPTNPNRAFFVADVEQAEGVHAYALQVPLEWLEAEEGSDFLRFKSHVLLSGTKGTSDVRFMPWKQAVLCSADSLARSAIAQLLTEEL